MSETRKSSRNLRDLEERNVEMLVGIETFSTSDIEGIGGEYKNNYKDFIVKEILSTGEILELESEDDSAPFSEDFEDNYTTFNLIKINKETFEAVRDIGKVLSIPSGLIQYAGLKDKCSISVQKMSIKGDFVDKLKKLRIKDLYIKEIVPTKFPIKIGSNWGNRFTIIVRNVQDKSSLENNINSITQSVINRGFPNYFGLQRYGTFRPNSHKIGRLLLEENYKAAAEEYITATYPFESENIQKVREQLKKEEDYVKAYEYFPKALYYERKIIQFLINHPNNFEHAFDVFPQDLIELLLSAFQSYIFNKMLSLRVKKGISLFEPLNGDVVCLLDDDNGLITQVKYVYGGLYDDYLTKAIKLNRAVIVYPIIGFNSNLDESPPMKLVFEEVIKEENIDAKIFNSNLFKKYDFKGSYRALTVKPTMLKRGELTNDDLFPGRKKLKLEFSLQKGSYATMLLRELMK